MLKRLVSLAFLALPLSASAFDFSNADELFAQRGEGDRFSNIKAAKAAYEGALTGTSTEEQMYALVQLSRLAYYEGAITTDTARQRDIYNKCHTDIEAIKPTKPDTGVEYYYWKGACLALWGRANGILSSLRRSGELEQLLLKGRSLDARYEGGGFDRLLANVYLKVPPVNPFGPTKDLDKALAAAEASIAMPAYPGEQDPATATGDYFYNSYDVKAQILAAKGRKTEALAVIDQAIARIEGEDYSTGRIPETLVHLGELKATRADISR